MSYHHSNNRHSATPFVSIEAIEVLKSQDEPEQVYNRHQPMIDQSMNDNDEENNPHAANTTYPRPGTIKEEKELFRTSYPQTFSHHTKQESRHQHHHHTSFRQPAPNITSGQTKPKALSAALDLDNEFQVRDRYNTLINVPHQLSTSPQPHPASMSMDMIDSDPVLDENDQNLDDTQLQTRSRNGTLISQGQITSSQCEQMNALLTKSSKLFNFGDDSDNSSDPSQFSDRGNSSNKKPDEPVSTPSTQQKLYTRPYGQNCDRRVSKFSPQLLLSLSQYPNASKIFGEFDAGRFKTIDELNTFAQDLQLPPKRS